MDNSIYATGVCTAYAIMKTKGEDKKGKVLSKSLKDDMQRFFTKLMQKSFLAAYCNINPSV